MLETCQTFTRSALRSRFAAALRAPSQVEHVRGSLGEKESTERKEKIPNVRERNNSNL